VTKFVSVGTLIYPLGWKCWIYWETSHDFKWGSH